VQALIQRGLVMAGADDQDGRARKLALTKAGRQLMDEIVPLAQGFERDLLRQVGGLESRQFLEGLGALEKVLRR